jgi:ADP-ribose pyrophosphatase YjhB (NUDIX family)
MLTAKVLAYITRGRELLIFRHRDLPEAGWQVPAGTVNTDESREAALWREIYEESGLGPEQLRLRRWLGVIEHSDDHLVRHYAWLSVKALAPDTWAHYVTGVGEDAELVVNYHWSVLPSAGRLAGLQDEMINTLLTVLEEG